MCKGRLGWERLRELARYSPERVYPGMLLHAVARCPHATCILPARCCTLLARCPHAAAHSRCCCCCMLPLLPLAAAAGIMRRLRRGWPGLTHPPGLSATWAAAAPTATCPVTSHSSRRVQPHTPSQPVDGGHCPLALWRRRRAAFQLPAVRRPPLSCCTLLASQHCCLSSVCIISCLLPPSSVEP